MDKFEPYIWEKLGSYVYALIHPKTGKPFYIGKGQENRVFDHVRGAPKKPTTSDKLDVIRALIAQDQPVRHLIIQHGLSNAEAHAVETALIDFAQHFGFGLTNVALGHGSSLLGIMTAEEVARKYSSERLTSMGEDCMIININASYKRAHGEDRVFEATRRNWVISKARRQTTHYVLAEYRQQIVEVFKVAHWYPERDHNDKERWAFAGKRASKEIRARYINKTIFKRRGESNPVRYTLSVE